MALEASVIDDVFLYVFETNEYIAKNTCLQKISIRNKKPTMKVFHCSIPTVFSTEVIYAIFHFLCVGYK